jgi:glycosyltransferase involved in cell wall biosynthesis
MTATAVAPMIRIALNMIIKNESKILPRFLENTMPWIDAAVICDTGSTDSSLEILTEWKSRIPNLHVYQDEWKNFGHNRSLGIVHAREAIKTFSKEDEHWYLLFLDADMKIRCQPNHSIEEFKTTVVPKHLVWMMTQVTSSLRYINLRLISTTLDFTCVCPTHEYYDIKGDATKETIPDWVYIDDVGDGGSKADKFNRDVRLLSEAIAENPLKERYWFYLANSYDAVGDHVKSIAAYEQRIRLGGWDDEVYVAHLYMGDVYLKMDKPDDAVMAWMKGYQHKPDRAEALYRICKHYRSKSQYNLSLVFYDAGKSIPAPSPPALFQEQTIYDYMWDFEMCVIGFYCNRKADGKNACARLMLMKNIPPDIQQRVEKNIQFY